MTPPAMVWSWEGAHISDVHAGEGLMMQEYRTLRVAEVEDGVLSVVIDAPPMNLIGPELVRDLVTLFGGWSLLRTSGSWCWRVRTQAGRGFRPAQRRGSRRSWPWPGSRWPAG
jgi:hypothetical protein